MKVVKRNGAKQSYDADKIYSMVKFCCNGLDASPSDIIMNAKLSIVDGVTTSEIHKVIIKSCEDLISENEPDYSLVAGRLLMVELHKNVFNGIENFPSLHELVKTNTALKLYTSELLERYSVAEIDELNTHLNHELDFNYHYAASRLWADKYLMRNRATGTIIETPQYANILIAMTGFINYDKSIRLDYVVRLYKALCKNTISLPTPIMAGLRTPLKQFSSCTVISVGDSLDSINSASNSIVKYASQRAGLGIDVSRIRAEGSPIKDGIAKTTGMFGFIRMLVNSLKSCSQGSIRDAACTIYFPIFHKEIESLIVLKNNEGNETNRIRESDYSVAWNDYLINRALNGEQISLFCPNDVPQVFELFYSANLVGFANAYEQAEKDTSIPRKVVSATDLLLQYIVERQKTQRLYPFFADEANTHTPFKDSIRMSNLCCEVFLPTVPDTSPSELDGLINLCTLGAVNVGKIRKQEDFKEPMHLLVRFLDAVLSYQGYPVESAERATNLFRPLGIGIINLSYYLAKHDLYNPLNQQEMRLKMHEIGEAMYYYGLEATVEIAQEFGKCDGYNRLKYADGEILIDNYNKNVDALVDYKLQLDWELLRAKQMKYGVRNATLLAMMPSENSSILSNATNGIEPVRKIKVIKENKGITSTQVVPEIKKLSKKYKIANTFTNEEFIDIQLSNMAILQKYVCQGISINTYTNAKMYDDNNIDVNDLLKQFTTAKNLGIKSLYYGVSTDTSTENDLTKVTTEEESCAGGACKI